jgi:response regulator of citrate/malate metabolism
MEWQTLIKPRVLIVEDDPRQLQAIKHFLDAISTDSRDLGIDHFDSDLALTVEEAERFFTQSNGEPYDLLLLDLSIPRKEGAPELAENGQELLEKVRREGAAKEVVVISIWYVVDQVARAFRSGAVDFIAKPYTIDVLQAKVIECWKRLLVKESTRLLGEERISDLVPYAEKGLAHRFTACFSSLVQAVAHGTEDIERYMQERYSLDRRKDSQDFFFKCLKWQEDSVAKAKSEWEALQTSLLSPNETSRVETVETLLKDIHQSLRPCLIVKNVTLECLDESTTEILTFEHDVRAVLKEIIVGTMHKLDDYDETRRTIHVKVGNANGQVKVSFTDRLEPISPEDAKNINEGSNIAPHRRFEREWGLSVVQHIAMRGGGRLEIEPQAQGNVVTYLIPSAR